MAKRRYRGPPKLPVKQLAILGMLLLLFLLLIWEVSLVEILQVGVMAPKELQQI